MSQLEIKYTGKQLKDIERKLLEHLLNGKSISSLQAWRIFKTSRLAVFIHRLRRKQFEIHTEFIKSNGSTYGKYKME